MVARSRWSIYPIRSHSHRGTPRRRGAVGGTIAIAHPLLAPLVLPLAALIAASRVTLRVHHVGDVVGGAVLGLLGAVGAALVVLH